jgi:hypothetical protein
LLRGFPLSALQPHPLFYLRIIEVRLASDPIAVSSEKKNIQVTTHGVAIKPSTTRPLLHRFLWRNFFAELLI